MPSQHKICTFKKVEARGWAERQARRLLLGGTTAFEQLRKDLTLGLRSEPSSKVLKLRAHRSVTRAMPYQNQV